MINGKWIVLLGAPGCGKGTQCELLINSEFHFKTICVGDILRNNKELVIQPLGKTVKEILGRGVLLPDSAIIELIKSALAKIENVITQNLIFDGFPRTIGQAEALDKITAEFGQKISNVINFAITDDRLMKRILGRFSCQNCGKIYNDYSSKPLREGVCDICGHQEFNRRKDDNEKSLSVRLQEYHDKTQPLINFYEKAGTLKSINANNDKATINKEIISLLKN